MRRRRPYGAEMQSFQDTWDRVNHQGKLDLCAAQDPPISYLAGKTWRQMPVEPYPEKVEIPEPSEPEVKIISPEIREYIPKILGKGDPETQVIVIGDDHAGAKTPSFDKKVYKKRYETLFQSAMTITELHRNMYPLNDLVIIDVGDNVQGENPYQGSTIGATECGAVEQVYDLALPTIASFLVSLKQQFKTVKFYGVRGNHGKYSRIAPQTSNWDLALYKALSNKGLPQGIEINHFESFGGIVEIEGFGFFAFHGDQIRNAAFGIPYFALIRAVKDWYVTFGGFPYAVCGHWHKEDYLRVTSETKLMINGAGITDDLYTLEQIKTSTIPNHWTFGVHKKHGLTWLYSLMLDPKFLPHKQVNGK
jgi:hypothetical protein